jgi:hypothetical protein
MMSEVPRLPLPDERAVMWLGEDWEVRLLMELLIAALCIPLGMTVVALLRDGAYDPDSFTVLVTAFSLMPLVIMASLRQPKSYLLTSHRIAEVRDGRLLWSLRFEQITRIRRIGATLHLRGPGKTTYSIQNLRHVFWLEQQLWERSTR